MNWLYIDLDLMFISGDFNKTFLDRLGISYDIEYHSYFYYSGLKSYVVGNMTGVLSKGRLTPDDVVSTMRSLIRDIKIDNLINY